MANVEQPSADSDAPRIIRKDAAGQRYGMAPRTAADIIRAAVAAGVLKKLGGKKRGSTVGRWSALDAFVANGGQVEKRGRR